MNYGYPPNFYNNDQEKRFIAQMRKMNLQNEMAWNNKTFNTGGYEVTLLQEGEGLTDDELDDCWTNSRLFKMAQLYGLHNDFLNPENSSQAKLYFKLPPPDDPRDGGSGS